MRTNGISVQRIRLTEFPSTIDRRTLLIGVPVASIVGALPGRIFAINPPIDEGTNVTAPQVLPKVDLIKLDPHDPNELLLRIERKANSGDVVRGGEASFKPAGPPQPYINIDLYRPHAEAEEKIYDIMVGPLKSAFIYRGVLGGSKGWGEIYQEGFKKIVEALKSAWDLFSNATQGDTSKGNKVDPTPTKQPIKNNQQKQKNSSNRSEMAHEHRTPEPLSREPKPIENYGPFLSPGERLT